MQGKADVSNRGRGAVKHARGRNVASLVILLAALAGWPAALYAQAGDAVVQASSSSHAALAEIRLQPGDVVAVEVRDEPSMGGQFQVAEDGTILIPLLGIVPVAGRTFAEVERDVRAAYARELADPVLRVRPLVRVAVLGEVMRPGLFPVDATHSIA